MSPGAVWTPRRLAAAAEPVITESSHQAWGLASFPLPWGMRLGSEGYGGSVMEVKTSPGQVGEIVRFARERGAEIIVTPNTQPPDLGERLVAEGLHLVRTQQVRYLGCFPSHWPRPQAQVRAAAPDELALWSAIVQLCYGLPANHRSHSAEATTRAVRECGGRLTCYLALVGGRAVGAVQTYRRGDIWRVAALGTLPDYRRRGVAGALLWQVAHDWSQAGGKLLFLEHAPQGAAHALYERLAMPLGYERTFYAAMGAG